MIALAGIGFALVVLTIIVSLLLRRQLREKYATLWILIGVVILLLAIFPGLLFGLSQTLGVEVPSNLLFALALVLLIGVALHLSWELSQAEDEVRRVAEDVAILRAEVEELQLNARSAGERRSTDAAEPQSAIDSVRDDDES
ncbi:DUF2304 domain-containing protein [Microbacterium allomyrinae]|jgi:hypothetical protein|uniref:DUF2304 domain-containing protein n=1 Tax=Microbacterium allomyrinae TaxID=2830666 RepID=A0A9X1LX31_9MICO|nr:DUF2304 domain-containing protein [Microbacterium allomyrinae]MCC2033406.1 DUF2304 domain-containing protein [Microbacterium allomyrinae]